jgi:hypothetical protein
MEDMLRYLDEMGEPTIKDFEEHPTSVRHGFLACVAAFHAIDYLAYPKKRPSDLRQRFRRQSPDFRIVDIVAHAFKHVAAGDRAKPDLTAHQVIPRPPSCDPARGLAVPALHLWHLDEMVVSIAGRRSEARAHPLKSITPQSASLNQSTSLSQSHHQLLALSGTIRLRIE